MFASGDYQSVALILETQSRHIDEICPPTGSPILKECNGGVIMGKILGNQRGESLIAVLFAVGIGGILIVGTMTFLDNLHRQVRSMEARSEAVETIAEVKSILALTKACKLNFEGRALPAMGIALRTPALKRANLAGTALTNENIVSVNQKLPHGSVVRAIGLRPLELVAALNFSGKLEIGLETKGSFVPSIVRSVHVIIKTDASNQVVDCTVDSSAGGATLRSCVGPPGGCPVISGAPVCTTSSTVYPSGTTWLIGCTSGGTNGTSLCLDGQWVQTAQADCNNNSGN